MSQGSYLAITSALGLLALVGVVIALATVGGAVDMRHVRFLSRRE